MPHRLNLTVTALTAAVLGSGVGRLSAQASVITHRFTVMFRDTIDNQQFVREGNVILGQTRDRSGGSQRYRLTLDPNGRIVGTCLASGGQDGSTQLTFADLRPSQARVRVTGEARMDSVTADLSGPAALYVPAILASVEQLIRSVPLRVGDSAQVLMVNFVKANTAMGAIYRISKDSIRVKDPNADMRLEVSDGGDILGGTSIPQPLPDGTSRINPLLKFRLLRQPDVSGNTLLSPLDAQSCGASPIR